MTRLPYALSFPLLAAGAFAQAPAVPVPAASPAATVTQALGSTTITIEYSRPGLRGRSGAEVWEKLVPPGQVWRTGANAATKITFTDDVKVGGKDLAAGAYAFFAIPNKESWTLIFSKRANQGGAFEYKQEEDAIRFDVKPAEGPMTEWLSYTVELDAAKAAADIANRARVVLRWEKVEVAFPVEVDVRATTIKRFSDAIAKAAKDDWNTAYQAARYLFQNNGDPKQAAAWIEHSIAAKATWQNHLLRGRMLVAEKKNAEAAEVFKRALAIAKEQNATAPQMKAIEDALKGVEAK